jgi:hypothetical protein
MIIAFTTYLGHEYDLLLLYYIYILIYNDRIYTIN